MPSEWHEQLVVLLVANDHAGAARHLERTIAKLKARVEELEKFMLSDQVTALTNAFNAINDAAKAIVDAANTIKNAANADNPALAAVVEQAANVQGAVAVAQNLVQALVPGAPPVQQP